MTTNSVDRMRIASDGKVGIGTITPTHNLEVREGGTSAAWTGVIASTNSAADRTAFLGTYNSKSVVAIVKVEKDFSKSLSIFI